MRYWLQKQSRSLLLALSLLLLALPVGMALLPAPQPMLQVTWGTQKTTRELHCLAKNIYFESRGEGFWGKVAVAQVTLNRVLHHTHFQSSICGVVYERSQFSWTLGKQQHIRDTSAWREALAIAEAVLRGRVQLPNFSATHYHTHSVKPRWRHQFRVVAVIGNHIFYA